MRKTRRKLARAAALTSMAGAALLSSGKPASAQTFTIPQWMKDSVRVDNRYLSIWEYFTGANIGSFDIWTQVGDPDNPRDDFRFIFTFDNMGVINGYGVPWGSRLFSSPHPPYGVQNPDVRPYCNLVTVRIDDPMSMTGFTDQAFPPGQNGSAVFAPPVVTLPRLQGFESPWFYNNGELQINEKLQFARDLVRIEYIVKNIGPTSHRVGFRLLLDPFVDYGWFRTDFTSLQETRSLFIPETRNRIFFETDFGARTGTPTRPRDPVIPVEWTALDDDEGPNPNFVAKAILRGNGATTPTRWAVVNSLNIYPAGAVWDYPVDNPMELRISDIATLTWWDPIEVPAGQTRTFVTYAGMGVASHAMSNAYLRAHQETLLTGNNETQGYIASVQTPFALPLRNGNSDIDDTGLPLFAPLTTYVQNMFHISNLPSAFAFVELPDGLAFAGEDPLLRGKRIDMGSLSSIGLGIDEGVGRLLLQTTGIESGVLPIRVTFSNGFGDSTQVIRTVNVPQGRRYQIGHDWRMLSFPFTYEDLADDPAVALGLEPGTFRVIRWNPLINQYEDVNQLKPGEGYWVRMLNLSPGQVRFTRLNDANPVKVATTDTSRTQVKTGWNQVGNPAPYAVRVRDIGVLVDGRIIDFDSAVAAGMIRSALYEYDRKTGQYVQLGKDTLVQPGRGVWLFSTAERTLVWRAPQGPNLSITP